jgi:hypothetical protein
MMIPLILTILLIPIVVKADVQHRVPPLTDEKNWSSPWAPYYVIGVPGFIDFEGLSEGQTLGEVIYGVKFTTTDSQDWRVGTWSSNNYNGKYPSRGMYTSQGDAWAWLGPSQGSGIITFTKGKATYFSCLVSTASNVQVDAYDANGQLIATSGVARNNLGTGTMDRITVTSPYRNIQYVVVHDSGNYWLIDCISTDAPGVELRLLVPHFKQNVEPWQGDDIVPGVKIRDYGCAMTSVAMVLRSYRIDSIDFGDGDVRPLDPGTLNEWLKKNNGYTSKGEIKWGWVKALTNGQVIYDNKNSIFSRSDYSWDSKDFSVVNKSLESRQPVILHVRRRSTPDRAGHYVVACGKVTYDVDDESKNHYLIRDPSWNYDSLNNDYYNNKFFGYRLYVPGDGVIKPLLNIRMYSPAEILITDSSGRRTGYDSSSNAILQEIPGTSYHEEGPIENPETGEVIGSMELYLDSADSGSYRLTVFGTGTGNYTIDIDSRDSSGQSFVTTLEGTTYPGKVDEYLISYSATSAEELAVIPVPPSGSIQANVKINPETLNLNAQRRWITAYIVLPDEYAVEEIDVGTVRLMYGAKEPLGADRGDIQGEILMVKFDGAAVSEWFDGMHGEEVELTVACHVNGIPAEGTTTIRIIKK